MAQTCERCGTEAPDGASFCAACGAPLASTVAGERKLATMLFADLVGSTELSAGADPEDLRRHLAPFFDVARRTLEEHGGTLEKYIGDAVLAVFGVPRAHDDDPDRAIAAGLALVERLGEVDDGLRVRIGIEAGEVLASERERDLSVTGEAVNVAARLQQAAAPGEILVGERCARACRRARLEPTHAIAAKGLADPVPAWRAHGLSVATDGPEAPLRGRDDDLDLLRLIYRRAVRERLPQLVTIVGDAGIGKTRLVIELVAELKTSETPPRVFIGRNPPYGRGLAFWALAEILRPAAGASPEDPASAVASGLEALASKLGATDAHEVAEALAVAVGMESEGVSEEDAEDAIRRAWRRLVGLLAADRPLVLVVDDVHWADDGFLDLLEEVAFGIQDAPLIVLCTSRPQLFERRSDFGRAARNVNQIELAPLPETTVASLVEPLLPEDSRGRAQQVAAVSQGNPFFAEEVARSIAQAGNGDSLKRLPDTVQAAIAARMDALPADEKRTLQWAAVLGHSFGERSLSRLLDEPATATLEALTRKALVRERITDGPGHFAFRHQLIREVAYDALPRRERALLHERAAASLGHSGEHAELLAFHLAQAAELDPSRERTDAALEATRRAAVLAEERGALARAQDLHEHASALAGADEADRSHELYLAAEIAIRRWRGDHGYRLMQAAGEIAEHAGDAHMAAKAFGRAVEVATRMAGVTGLIPEDDLRHLLDRARALAPDDDLAVNALLQLDEIWVEWARTSPTGRIPHFAEALAAAREAGDSRLLSSALDAAAAYAWSEHRYTDALGYAWERDELIRSTPKSPAMAVERNDTTHMLIESLLQTGRLKEAAEQAARAREFDLSHGMVYSGWARGVLPAFFLGEWDRLLEMSEMMREAWLAEERPPIAAMAAAIACAGAVHGLRGHVDVAADWFSVARSMAGESTGQRGGIHMFESMVHLHRREPARAVDLLEDETGGFWWGAAYTAVRAEAFVLAGRRDVDSALLAADAVTQQNPFGHAVVQRARGLTDSAGSRLRSAREEFAAIGSPYEVARTDWLIGGESRDAAAETFARLKVTIPED